MNLHKHRVAGKPFVFGKAGASGDAPRAATPLPTIITTRAEDSVEGKAEEPGTMSDTAEKQTAPGGAGTADASAMV